MTMVAHITDLHLVEKDFHARCAVSKARLLYLNTGRGIDPSARRKDALDALLRASHSDHVVVTGDITEDGTHAQFELLAEVLAESKLPPECVTLVPGNHDYYEDPANFARALRGPLRPYARSSTCGRPIDFGDTIVVPMSTAIPQSYLRSGGALSSEDSRRLEQLAADAGLRRKTMLIAQHHPPLGHQNAVWNWIDGLRDPRPNEALLSNHEHVHVLHGHDHKHRSHALHARRPRQVHCGGAVLHGSQHVRFYDAGDGGLRALEAANRPAATRSELARLASATTRGTLC